MAASKKSPASSKKTPEKTGKSGAAAKSQGSKPAQTKGQKSSSASKSPAKASKPSPKKSSAKSASTSSAAGGKASASSKKQETAASTETKGSKAKSVSLKKAATPAAKTEKPSPQSAKVPVSAGDAATNKSSKAGAAPGKKTKASQTDAVSPSGANTHQASSAPAAKARTAESTARAVPPASKKKAPAKSRPFSPSFLARQRQRLLELRDSVLESMNGVAKDTLRSRPEGSESSAFGMHQADAGSDSYDRDFALGIISQEQNSLYEIEEALKRIENGTYGICEISGKPIPVARLEALPFTRYTVECQAELEKKNRFRARPQVTSLFGLTDEDDAEDEEGLDSKE